MSCYPRKFRNIWCLCMNEKGELIPIPIRCPGSSHHNFQKSSPSFGISLSTQNHFQFLISHHNELFILYFVISLLAFGQKAHICWSFILTSSPWLLEVLLADFPLWQIHLDCKYPTCFGVLVTERLLCLCFIPSGAHISEAWVGSGLVEAMGSLPALGLWTDISAVLPEAHGLVDAVAALPNL